MPCKQPFIRWKKSYLINAKYKEEQTLWMMKKMFKIETLRNVVPYIFIHTPILMWSGFIWIHGKLNVPIQGIGRSLFGHLQNNALWETNT